MSIASRYTGEMYDRYRYLATWLPNKRIELGDVGVLEGDVFKRLTSLADLQITFAKRPGKDTLEFNETSNSGVKIDLGATTTAPGAGAGGGLTANFSEEGAFVFRASGCLMHEIADKVSLGKEVLAQCKSGLWDANWRIVDTVVRAESSTIMLSRSKQSSLSLSATSPLQLANLASADTKLTVVAQSGDILHMLAEKGLTPLFTLLGVKQSWISKLFGGAPTFGGVASVTGPEEPTAEDLFEPVVPPR